MIAASYRGLAAMLAAAITVSVEFLAFGYGATTAGNSLISGSFRRSEERVPGDNDAGIIEF